VLSIRMTQDMLAGVIFMAIGAAALWFGAELDVGTSAEMGAGYVPRALAWIIIAMGAGACLRSFWLHSPAVGAVALRPIVVLLIACAAFAFLIEDLGFVLTSALTILISLFARRGATLGYVVAMVVILPAALALVFIVGLGLPFDLWWF
jgi:putative tricarboxylic transport membrane protein